MPKLEGMGQTGVRGAKRGALVALIVAISCVLASCGNSADTTTDSSASGPVLPPPETQAPDEMGLEPSSGTGPESAGGSHGAGAGIESGSGVHGNNPSGQGAGQRAAGAGSQKPGTSTQSKGTPGTSGVGSSTGAPSKVLFRPAVPSKKGVVTNEYAFFNPTLQRAVSADWNMTSGSLFSRDGAFWSGVPDVSAPNATSSNHTNSAVFRLTTKRADFGDVSVNFDLNHAGLTSTASTPAVAWDGIHIFLRYQSEQHLYYASVARRDGHVVVKKKCPGGVSNGGTYSVVGQEVSGHPVAPNTWQNVGATIRNNSDGSVRITVSRAGKTILNVVDTGVGSCAPIRKTGATGIRGDNSNFMFRNFTVTA